jgi:hypothetical protein
MASKIPSHEAVGVLENDEIKQINLGASRDDELEEALDASVADEEEDDEDEEQDDVEAAAQANRA